MKPARNDRVAVVEGKSMGASLNCLFDGLPRVSFFRHAREVPAWRSCGLAGFYVGALTAFGAGLFAGRSLLVLSCVILVSVGSFFAYAHIRKWITGRERFVLLEHVWIALLVAAGTLVLAGEQVLPYLDLFSLGLPIFLAGGRAGCLLVGCCFGHPASLGVTYGREHAESGFPRHLLGVRLFPVQCVEMAGLLLISAAGFVLLGVEPPGTAFAWFLIAYAVMRFGLEALRGDRRPCWLTFSQAQWMSVIQAGATILWLQRGDWTPGRLAAAVMLFAVMPVAAALRRARNPRARLLTERHIEEVRTSADLLRAQPTPSVVGTSETVTVGVSSVAGSGPEIAHVSLSMPRGQADLRLMCDLAHRAFPSLLPDSATCTNRVFHFLVPVFGNGTHPRSDPDEFYGAALRSAQGRDTRLHAAGEFRPAPRGTEPASREASNGLNGNGRKVAPPLPGATEAGHGDPVAQWRFRL